ncbi:MAG: response regulator transcription factor, partial [Actinomycetota bacterium]|nr:response regulator transcription factor [Actinomycetota bacterium]
TVSDAEQDVLDAVAAGALGYLTKTTTGDDLRAALRRAARGEPVFPPELAMLLIGEFRKLARQSTGTNPITPREREVLILVARGHSYRQIGEELYISPKTVENHVRNTLDKLHLTRRDQLIRYAVEHGLE